MPSIYQKGSSIAARKRHAIYLRDNWTCLHCGYDMSLMAPQDMSVDHAISQKASTLTDGKANHSFSNLFASCQQCNSMRGETPLEDWVDGPEHMARILTALATPVSDAIVEYTRQDVFGKLGRKWTDTQYARRVAAGLDENRPLPAGLGKRNPESPNYERYIPKARRVRAA